jgi:hypothetical protein
VVFRRLNCSADIAEPSVNSIFIGGVPAYITYENGTVCSETSAHKIHAPGKKPKERIQQFLDY